VKQAIPWPKRKQSMAAGRHRIVRMLWCLAA
jgi:hypothetical protein